MLRKYKNRPRDEAMELIETYIAENSLAPHDKLPSERDMCDMWNLNRSTLRSATRRLIQENRLYAKVGAGTFVAPPIFLRNLQDLETLASVAAREGRILSTCVHHATILECNKELSQKLRVMLGHKLFALQRVRSLDGVPFILELSYVDYERCPGIEAFDLATDSLYRILREEYGVRVDHGQESISITYATEQEAALLHIPVNTAAFFMNGISRDADGTPVESFKAISRADRILFTSVLTNNGDLDADGGTE